MVVPPADPITLAPGRSVGGLGLESHTRRRNRINGTVETWDPAAGSLHLAVDQSFGNCPKYITVRPLGSHAWELSSVLRFSRVMPAAHGMP